MTPQRIFKTAKTLQLNVINFHCTDKFQGKKQYFSLRPYRSLVCVGTWCFLGSVL